MPNRITIVCLLSGIAATGCEMGSPVSEVVDSVPQRQLTMGQSTGVPFPDAEGRFETLGKDIPGFAGYYVNNDGVLVVRLKDLSQGTRAQLLLRAIAIQESGSATRAPSDQVIVQAAEYDFSELAAWRNSLRPLLGVTGVLALDANEGMNRVWVGVASLALRGVVLTKVKELGIPDAAVTVDVVRPEIPLTTLDDSIRPAPGGIRIEQTDGAEVCTLSVNGYKPDGKYGFLTVSHCTLTQGGVENTRFSQPSEFIGTETDDPVYWSGGSCPPGRLCRNSDAAFAEYSDTTFGEFARIAQPDSVCHGNCGGNPAIKHISDTNPRWIIQAVTSNPITQGIGLQKVGRTTGWTYGLVTHTCMDYNTPNSNITLFCQARVSAIAAGGDSGAPVFRFVAGAGPNKVALYGILHAGSPSPATYIFSPWPNVIGELGTITVK